MEIDNKIILKLIKVLEELKQSIDGSEIKVDENDNNEMLESGLIIKSPIVGTAYLAPEPGAANFIEVGKKIKKGDTLLIVEAMKTMNHVPSSENGIVKKVCVKDGEPVEFDQRLVILE